MQKRTAYTTVLFGVAGLLLVCFVAFFTFGQTSKWVRHTDIEVCFVVTDTETGHPIRNATIHIRAEPGGFCDDPPQLEFAVTTDNKGVAKKQATNCMCTGSKGIHENTFASHLPHWSFQVTAAGYSESLPAYLNVSENARHVQRGDPFATLTVPIGLRKKDA